MIPKSLCDDNGEPMVYTHRCAPGREGQPMTIQELDEFAKEIVREKFISGRSDIREGVVPGADLFLDGAGGSKKDIVVRYRNDSRNDYGCSVLPFRMIGETPVYPVLATVELWYAKGDDHGLRLAGGDYFAIVFFESLLPKEGRSPKTTSADEAAKLIYEAWKGLDASYFEGLLAEDFQYASTMVFDVISSEKEYLHYISGKFETIKRTGGAPAVSLLRNAANGAPVIRLDQNGTIAILDFKMKDGYVSDMILHPEDGEYQDFDAPLKMMGLYEFEFRFLPYMLNESLQGKIRKDLLASKNFLKECVQRNVPLCEWDWEQFDIQVIDVHGAEPIIVYHFPEPDMPPLARFAAIVSSTYFTLEKGEKNAEWWFCSQDTVHHNMGNVAECRNAEEFVTLLEYRILKTKADPDRKSLWDRIKNLFS